MIKNYIKSFQSFITLLKKAFSSLIILCLFIYPQNLKADTDITSDTTITTLASGGYNITSGNTLTANLSSDVSYGDVIRGAGSLSKTGTGNLTLSATNTFTGNLKISDGRVTLGTSGVASNTAIEFLDGGMFADARLYLTNSGNYTIGGLIGDNSGWNATNPSVVLGGGVGNHDYTINVATGNSFSTSATITGPSYGDGQLIKSGAGEQTLSGTISSLGDISGSPGIIVTAGKLTLSSTSNSFDGGVEIRGGTLSVSNDGSLGSVPGTVDEDNIIFNGGALEFTGTDTINSNRGITMTGAGTINVTSSNTLTYGGSIVGSGNITKSGSGSLLLSGTSRSYSGDITVDGGTLSLGAQSVFNYAHTSGPNITLNSGSTLTNSGDFFNRLNDLTINSATLTSTGGDVTDFSGLAYQLNGTVTASGTSTISNNDITLGYNGSGTTFNVASGGTLTVSSDLLNSHSTTWGEFTASALTKSGSGTLVLSGTNTYSSGTTVSAGTLEIGNNSALGSGNLTLSSGSKVSSNNTTARTLSNNLVFNNGGTITIGDTTKSGALTFGTATLNADTTTTVDSNAIISQLNGNFALTKNGSGTLTITTSESGGTGATTINAGSLVFDQDSDGDGTFTRTGTTTINGGSLVVKGSYIGNQPGGAPPGSSTWGTPVVMSGGTIRFENGTTITDTTNGITGSGGIIELTGTTSPLNVATVFYRINNATIDNSIQRPSSESSLYSLGSWTHLGRFNVFGTGDFTMNGTLTGAINQYNGTFKTGSSFDGSDGAVIIYANDATVLGNTSPSLDLTGQDLTISVVGLADATGTGTPSIIDSTGTGSLTFTSMDVRTNNLPTGLTDDDNGDDIIYSPTISANATISAKLAGSGTIYLKGNSILNLTSDSSAYTGDINFSDQKSHLNISSGQIGTSTIDMLSGVNGESFALNESTLTIGANSLANSTPTIKMHALDTINFQGSNTNSITLISFADYLDNGDGTYTGANLDYFPRIVIADNVTASFNVPSSHTETEHTSNTPKTLTETFNRMQITGGTNSAIKFTGSGTLNFDGFADTWQDTNDDDTDDTVSPGFSGDIIIAGATVNLENYDEIANTSNVTVESGTLNFGSNADTINSLTVSGGTVSGSSGTLNTIGNITVSGGTVSVRSLNGAYQLSGGTVDSLMYGSTLTVTGDTTTTNSSFYSGATSVNSGTFTVTGIGFGTTGAATTVASGASVHIDRSGKSLQSYAEEFNLSGTGVSNSGALQATGAVTLTGAINLNADTRIVSNSGGTLVLSNTVTGIDGSSGNYNLTLAGAGDMTISGPINLGTGTLTKGVSGTLTLSGALTAGGVTDLNRATISANVTTSGNQTYQGGADIGPGTITLTSNTGNVTFSDTVRGSGTANVSIAGNLVLNSGANVESSVTSLSVSGTTNLAANVTTANTQTYTGATTLSAASALTTTNSNITFSNTINSSNSTARNLTINTGSGTTQFAGVVGGTNALGAIGITGNLDLDAAITGASSLSVSGTSNLGANVTTTGAQTYSGTTTLSGSDRTLQGSSITLAAVTGGSNSLTITGNLDLDGAISGVDDLSVSGTSDIGADVTTTGTQTYSGTTTLSASSTLEGPTVNLNAVTGGSNALTVTGNLDLDGAISGVTNLSVSVTSNIGANVTTTGTQTYTLVTTLSTDATLTGTAITASAVSLGTNDLSISNSAASAISGAVTGTGGLTKAGSGALTMSNASTYTGDTTINAGTLTVTGTLSDSTDVIVASGATYDVDQNDTVESVTGSGTTNIASGKTLTVSSSSNKSSSVVFEGSGNFVKSGSGTLTLLGTNTISGDVTVSDGTLYAGNASSSTDTIFNTNVTVNGSNAVLGGGGIIAGNVTVTNGAIAPGNSIGTLYVSGDLNLTSNSTTNIEFNASAADKIVVGVGGNTSIDGTISLYPENVTYSTTSFTIVDASAGGTFSGTFATETMNNQSNLNGATWDIVYDTTGKTVKLNLTEGTNSDSTDTTNTIQSTTTVTKFKDIAKIFDQTDLTGDFLDVKNILDSATVNSVNTELNKLEGTVLASTFTQASNNHGFFNRALNSVTTTASTSVVSNFTSTGNDLSLTSLQDQGLYGNKKNFNEYYDYSDGSVLGFIKNNKNKTFFENFNTEDRSTFLRTYGTLSNRKDIGASYTGYKSETTGVLFGEQFKNSDEEFNGYSIGLTHTGTDYNRNYGDADVYSLHASLFKQLDQKDQAFNLLGSAFISRTDSTRNVAVFGTSVDDKYKSDFYDLGFNVEAQHVKKFDINGYKISPSFKTNYTYVFKGDTKETGGDFALKVENDDLFTIKPEFGLSLGKDFSKDRNKVNQFDIAAFASRDYFIEGKENTARFASGTGTAFNQELPRDYEDYYSLGLGYNFLNKETDTSLMANVFLIENTKKDSNSNIFSFTFRKLFGEFGKDRIPPVIAKKSEEDIIKVVLPDEKSSETVIAEGEKSLEQLGENIEIVLKENPTEEEVGEVYRSLSENLIVKRQLTVNDVYKNLAMNCYAVENNLVQLVNYYNKLQLYKILDKCNKLSEPKVHLIAERLHQIQLDETTKLEELYFGYLKLMDYLPYLAIVILIGLIILGLIYEYISRIIVKGFGTKRSF